MKMKEIGLRETAVPSVPPPLWSSSFEKMGTEVGRKDFLPPLTPPLPPPTPPNPHVKFVDRYELYFASSTANTQAQPKVWKRQISFNVNCAKVV